MSIQTQADLYLLNHPELTTLCTVQGAECEDDYSAGVRTWTFDDGSALVFEAGDIEIKRTVQMTTTFKNETISNAKNLANEKELVEEFNAVLIHDGEIKNPVTVRWYMGRSKSASKVYCSIWVSGANISVAGHGTAGGGGYCKKSASFARACESAGIETIDADGRGTSVVREALTSICEALGYSGKVTVIG